jgi:glutathione S-transferase
LVITSGVTTHATGIAGGGGRRVDSDGVEQGIFAFEKLFHEMEEALEPGQDWLVGTRCSLGDINIIPFAARLHYLNLLDMWIADRPQRGGSVREQGPVYPERLPNY